MSLRSWKSGALGAALVQSLALAGAAHAGGIGAGFDEVLPVLPADAGPGECYARVIVPGQPVAGPQNPHGAKWVLNPGPPGAPGPIWCLVPTGPAPVMFTPEREGFIRVLCDTDATPERVGRWQRRLHGHGYYKGEYSGRYDAATAEAVTRFQADRHIRHGGYLSRETVDALEAGSELAPPPPVIADAPPPPPPVRYAKPGKAPRGASHREAAAAAGGVGYAPYAATNPPPVYGQPAYPDYPNYPAAQPGYPQTQVYPQAGYVRGYVQPPTGYSVSGASAGPGYSSQYGYSYGESSSYSESASYGATTQAYGYSAGAPYSYGYAYGAQQGHGHAAGAHGVCCQSQPYYPRPAYAAYGPQSAVQDGWLTWTGKPHF